MPVITRSVSRTVKSLNNNSSNMTLTVHLYTNSPPTIGDVKWRHIKKGIWTASNASHADLKAMFSHVAVGQIEMNGVLIGSL